MSSSPLLGTPYLVSASSTRATTSTTRVTPSLCESITQFKRLISSSRSLDDAITTRLNRANALARTSNGGGGGTTTECEQVWQELKQRWVERNKVLTYCDTVLSSSSSRGDDTTNRTTTTRREEVGLSAEKGQLGRGRSTENELKLQQLHLEFSTERIIRRRTLDLLFSRCPSLSLPSPSSSSSSSSSTIPTIGSDLEAVQVPRALGEEGEDEERKRRRGRDERGGVRWA